MRSGQYRSAVDVLDEALSLLKARDSVRIEARKRIEAALIEGLDSGSPTPMTSDDWDEVEREGRRIIARRKVRKDR
jgi:Arc/MetJ-type ribon-helix-helix transcriptional regulator